MEFTLQYAAGSLGEKQGHFLHARASASLASDEAAKTTIPKRLIMVTDCSGSMEHSPMRYVKATLLAVGKVLEIHAEVEYYVIAFNETAQLVWTPIHDRKDYADMVQGLRAEKGTHLEAATQLAHAVAARGPASRITYIVYLTDGEPTVGETHNRWFAYQAAKQKDDFTVTYALGLGSGYKEQLLRVIGRFVHVESEAAVSSAIGQILGQLLATRYMSCSLTTGDGTALPGGLIAGDVAAGVPGQLPGGSSYSWVWSFASEKQAMETASKLALRYADAVTGILHMMPSSSATLTKLDAPSKEMALHFFAKEAGDLTRELSDSYFAPDICARVALVLDQWDRDPAAMGFALHIRQLIRERNIRHTSSYSVECHRQDSTGADSSSATPYAASSSASTMDRLVSSAATGFLRRT